LSGVRVERNKRNITELRQKFCDHTAASYFTQSKFPSALERNFLSPNRSYEFLRRTGEAVDSRKSTTGFNPKPIDRQVGAFAQKLNELDASSSLGSLLSHLPSRAS